MVFQHKHNHFPLRCRILIAPPPSPTLNRHHFPIFAVNLKRRARILLFLVALYSAAAVEHAFFAHAHEEVHCDESTAHFCSDETHHEICSLCAIVHAGNVYLLPDCEHIKPNQALPALEILAFVPQTPDLIRSIRGIRGPPLK